MRKNKVFLLLALLLTAATGAWAQTTYTVVGSNSNMFGSAWDADATANDMTKNGDGTYSITYTDVYLDGDVQYKVLGNHDWENAYPIDDSRVIKITEAGTYSFTIHFNPTTQEVYETKPGYTVTMKDGVKDAGNWSIEPNEGLKEGDQVTLTYTGRLKVKGVKATSDAEAASVPDGAISGVFSVSDSKKVYFSKGNLRYASSKWSFFDNQYDYYESHSDDAWDKFGWSTSAPTYGMNTSTNISDYQGDFVDWGATMGAGWFTLSNDEWTYLINIRTVNGGTGNGKSYTRGQSVNGKLGVVIYPDNYTGEVYSGSDWATFESAGCVFLPAAGRRNGSSMEYAGERGYYWSATPNGTNYAYGVQFTSDILNPASANVRRLGLSVRLVREVATSDAEEAKPAATVTTAPTGAAIVGAGKTTALVSGGVAEGGTLRYAVTTENTKPTSTDGFSDAVPTAQSITASGKVYVWYYVKGDDTHSDSEIAATAIEVTVKALPITVTWNASDIVPENSWDNSFTKDGITITAATCNFVKPTFGGGGTFTNTLGNFTKIEISADYAGDVSGTGWSNDGWQSATWTGNAASVSFSGEIWGGGMTCDGGNLTIVFTIE